MTVTCITRDEASFVAVPNLQSKVLTSAGTSAINRASAEVTKATTGVVDVIDLLDGMPIQTILLSFVKGGATENDTATFQLFAGRDDYSSFKEVFAGTVTIGVATCGKLPDGTVLTTGLWADLIVTGGNDYWGATIIGHDTADIAQLKVDLRGYRYLYLTCSVAAVKTVICGY